MITSVWVLQAQPLLKDRRNFTQMADPRLQGNYPVRGLYQALAVAAMCLQEEDSTRPLISDIVIALEYLSAKRSSPGATEGDEEEEEDPSCKNGGEGEEQREGGTTKDTTSSVKNESGGVDQIERDETNGKTGKTDEDN